MYDSTTTVTVGLDVHARSMRLAAVRADELLEERTLPYDEQAVEQVLRRWPVVRCCYEAGPTGFGLQRFLVEQGFDCRVVAPGLVPQRPGDRVKTDPRDARKLALRLAGGLLAPIHVPSPELEAARDLVRAREDARLDRMRDRHRLSKFCLRHGRRLPTSSWTVARRKWLSEQRFEFAAQQQTFTYVHAVDLVDARSPNGRGVHGLRRRRSLRALFGRAAAARIDHQGRQRTRTSAAGRVGLARTPPPQRRLSARAPPTRPGRRCDRARLALPATPARPLATDGRPRQTTAED